MDLQVNGKCIKVFETQYTSKKDGQKHQKHHFVIEVKDGEFLKNVCFTVINEDRWSKMNVVEGGTYNVSFDVLSREYNGNYYTDVNAWRAVRVDITAQNAAAQAQAPVQQPQPAPQPAPQVQVGNDLPF